jgi:hypothetical protein
LEQKIKNKFARDGTMCKDNWNSLNSNYNKLINYYKGIRNHIYFWDLSFDKKKNVQLLCQFNRKFYKLIEAFQGERNVTMPLHVRDVNVKNHGLPGLVHAMPKT